jgi:hypothetical protein
MTEIKHKWQQTDYTCGAAAVAMILGISEKEAVKLAGTTRSGTHQYGARRALETSGHPVHSVHCDALPLSLIGWALDAQSQRWPLYLSLGFPEVYVRRDKRKFTKIRRHAVVLYRGQLFDPGEVETLTIDSLGHLADKEVVLNGYLIVETP